MSKSNPVLAYLSNVVLELPSNLSVVSEQEIKNAKELADLSLRHIRTSFSELERKEASDLIIMEHTRYCHILGVFSVFDILLPLSITENDHGWHNQTAIET